MNKKILIPFLLAGCLFSLTGCGKDQSLETYKENMTVFCNNIIAQNEVINSIDPASETASENRKICSVFFDRRFPVCTRYLQNRCTGCAVCLRYQCSRRRNHNGCHCSNKPVPRNAGRCCCKTAWIINSVT